MITTALQANDPSIAARAQAVNGTQTSPFGDDGLTPGDFLDVINPLQHIPVLGSIYRRLTGDQIAPAARIAGGALYGGPVGVAVSVAAVMMAEARSAPTSNPSPASSAEPVADAHVTRVTESQGRQPARGGWMVAYALHGGTSSDEAPTRTIHHTV